MHEYDLIAAYYDVEHDDFAEDVNLYLNFIERGPVLEIGAGTGRILGPLAAAGLDLWGVEPSVGMRARASQRTANFECANLVPTLDAIPPDVRFRAAVFGLNTLWHFRTLHDQLDILQRVRKRLEDGAHLYVDTSNPLAMADRDAAGEVREAFRRAQDGETLIRYTASWDDPGEQTLRVSLTFETLASDGTARKSTSQLELRYVYRWELELMLRHARFELVSAYGSYDLEPYGTGSPRIFLQARAN